MQPLDIVKLLKATPFQPFRIRMTNGDKYEIRHPELALVSPSWVHISYLDEDGLVNDFRFLSLTQILDIELLHEQSAGLQNGA